MTKERIYLNMLLNKACLTDEEMRLLVNYLSKNDTPKLRQLLLEKFADDLLAVDTNALPHETSEKILGNIYSSILEKKPSKVVSIFRMRNIAAASVVFLLVASVFFLIKPNKPDNNSGVIAKSLQADVIAPKGNRAMIILANGKKLFLDSNNSGLLAMQGDILIEKSDDGKISYKGSTFVNEYNTLFNPRGSKPVELTLSDGSKVWLNSESSVRYPVSFVGIERLVEITGEAYFEVEKVPGSTFRVAVAGKSMIEVLGTHFNVNSYAEENQANVTLLEGSITLSLPPSRTSLANTVNIAPGQQASYNISGNTPASISVKDKVDLNAVMAWKNGYFNFDNSNLQAVMRQLARWYDIQVTYEGKIPSRIFGGEMQRDLNLSEVLKLLEKNNIHFSIQNKQLLVKP